MPIIVRCCACKRLRDDDGNWVEPDQLILPAEVGYSDGFCPPCFRTTYPDYAHLADSGGRLGRLVALWQKGERPPGPMVGKELSNLWRRALWSWLPMTIPGLEVVAGFWARRRRGPEKGGPNG